MPDSRGQRGATVAGCGAIAVDELLFLDRGLADGKGRVLRREHTHGGNIATALAAVGSLGGTGRLLGYLSERSQWPRVHEDLESFGVDLGFATVTEAPPIRSTILVAPDGERFIAFDDATDVGAPLHVDPCGLDGAGALLVDRYAVPNGLPLVEHARAGGLPVIADLERADTEPERLLQDAADHLVIPLSLARTVTGLEAPEAAEALWHADRDAVVITDGENGAWLRTADTSAHVPARRVDVVDTSGCGDVFHGVYALRIAQGRSVTEAVVDATAGAAVCAGGAGGRGRLPTEDELGAPPVAASGARVEHN